MLSHRLRRRCLKTPGGDLTTGSIEVNLRVAYEHPEWRSRLNNAFRKHLPETCFAPTHCAQSLEAPKFVAKKYRGSKVAKDLNPDWPKKDPKASGGMILLALAWIFLATNLAIELNTFIALINDPIFVPGTPKMNSSISIGTGWAQVVHVIFFLPIGVVMLAAAGIRSPEAKKGRTKKIVILTTAGILLFPGTLSVAAAGIFGPTPTAKQGIQNAVDSKTTIDRIRSEGVAAEFKMIDEYWPGEPDTSWRTGVFNLEVPEIPKHCALAIDLAVKNGATQMQELPSGQPADLTNRVLAIDSCVKTMNSYPHKDRHRYELVSPELLMSGKSTTAPNSPVIFRLTLIKYGYAWEKPNTWGYELFISTNYAGI